FRHQRAEKYRFPHVRTRACRGTIDPLVPLRQPGLESRTKLVLDALLLPLGHGGECIVPPVPWRTMRGGHLDPPVLLGINLAGTPTRIVRHLVLRRRWPACNVR